MGDGTFTESSTQVMTLSSPEVTIDAVERFAQCLYTGDFDISRATGLKNAQVTYMQLAELYVFADKDVLVDLKNSVINKFFDLRTNKNTKELGAPRLAVIRMFMKTLQCVRLCVIYWPLLMLGSLVRPGTKILDVTALRKIFASALITQQTLLLS